MLFYIIGIRSDYVAVIYLIIMRLKDLIFFVYRALVHLIELDQAHQEHQA